jgi:hypothetical protein
LITPFEVILEESVEADGLVLEFIKEQTPEICMAAAR